MMLLRALPKILTIALAIVMLAIGTPGWAQICAGQLAPATPAAPRTPAASPPWKAPAAPVRSGGDTSLASGLVSYWKLDDASGTTVTDSVGSNNGTWNGTLGSQWTTGKINDGGNFNGTDNYVNVPDALNLRMSASNAFTLSAWVNFNAWYPGSCGRNMILIKGLDSGGGGGSYFLGANNTGTCSTPTHPAITQILKTDGNFYFLQGTTNLSTGVWLSLS
jgi:hypothetical protein